MKRCLRLVLGTFSAGNLLFPSTGTGQASVQVASTEYPERRAKVTAALQQGILIVPSKFDIKAEDQHGFHQNADFYYLSGLGNTPRMVLLIDGPRQQSVLFIAPLPEWLSRWAVKPTPGP